MRIQAEAFTAPKAGSAESEYEDAVWPDRALRVDRPRFRCAVADGATETSYSRAWAHLLVNLCANARLEGPADHELADARARWRRGVDIRLAKAHPWYAEAKARSGAFAALVTLDLCGDALSAGGTWTSYAIGDCCLVHIRADVVIAAYPLVTASAFNDRPRLLGSVPTDVLDAPTFARCEGSWADGDVFLLMSDAIAAWFHRQRETGERPWRELGALSMKESSSFRSWITELRDAKSLKNDDVTVLRVRVSSDGGA